MTKQMKYIRLASTVFTIVLCAVPAFAANKDMIQLQTQVQQLQDSVARLQQSNDERMGVMKDLVQQNADQVNKMSATMEALSHSLQTQNEAQGTKLDQLSGQIQSLNDSLDEIKARLGKLEALTQGIQNQQQTITAPSTPAPDNTPPPSATQAPLPDTAPTDRKGKPSAGIPMSDATPSAPTGPAAAPVGDLYKSALGDYMAAKYSLAAGEFADVIRYYPDQALSGNSFYYLGEIDYRAGKFEDAIKDYDMVLQHFPDNNKIPASRLHKGQAYFALKQNDAGVRELRALIQRFPNAPEAMLARSKLSGMGITVTPRHTAER
ncbi:tetratricopeptide repeat protein [Granulicella arctica]|uniref:TolA-binding protein n=1 Tax=Granulicella arctica TaxID=940613 RepID=A0A7Y9PJU8_9BACT|nr:tetratricopeptide repeat protein [Granulicella arctica]NYF80388.1 TolA-binding protein [Granulicella arctica]